MFFLPDLRNPFGFHKGPSKPHVLTGSLRDKNFLQKDILGANFSCLWDNEK